MNAFLISTSVVSLAEIGDKTQLLALLLAARYRAPLAIMAGITLATIANHGLAGWLGHWAAAYISDESLRWLLAASFIAMAGWVLIPDRLGKDDAPRTANHMSAFWASLVAFFLLEIGDKTQIATIALAARYEDALFAVVAGTTAGMLIANLPCVLLGHHLKCTLPMQWVRRSASALFAAMSLWLLVYGI